MNCGFEDCTELDGILAELCWGLSEPEALAAFLASGPAAYVTGQAIVCDGGYLRGY